MSYKTNQISVSNISLVKSIDALRTSPVLSLDPDTNTTVSFNTAYNNFTDLPTSFFFSSSDPTKLKIPTNISRIRVVYLAGITPEPTQNIKLNIISNVYNSSDQIVFSAFSFLYKGSSTKIIQQIGWIPYNSSFEYLTLQYNTTGSPISFNITAGVLSLEYI